MLPFFRKITSTGKFIKYFTLEPELEILRKQLLFRSKNLGVKELDLLVGNWAKNNLQNMNDTELKQFNEEVLLKETPDLTKMLLTKEETPTQHYLVELRKFAQDVKSSKSQA